MNWQKITAPGQVKPGHKLRFTIGDEKYLETAKLILNAGTGREEIIYNKKRNYYLITSMAIENQGSQKNVEFLAVETIETITKQRDDLKLAAEELQRNLDTSGGVNELLRMRVDELELQNDDLMAALERIGGFTLSQFMGPHDMALECVNVANSTIAAVKEKP